MKRSLLGYVLIVPILLQSACVSMEAVQNYATYTQATVEEVRPVARDFHASCMRSNSYKPLANHSECSTEQRASRAIVQVARVLDSYGAALGALATDELVNYETDIGVLKENIKGLNVKGLDDQKIDAVGNLAAFIGKAATSRYQQKEVAQFINESNESVVKVSDTLAGLIDTNYSQAIRLEISAWEDTYRRVERVARDTQPLEWEAYSREQWELRAQLEARIKAANDLARSIQNIGITHAGIKEDANELTGQEVVALVRTFVNEARPVIKEIRASF